MKISKRFMGIVMAVILVLSCVSAFAEGDAYATRDERYPTKYWGYMTPEEIAHYEAIGWQRVTGVLWYDTTDDNSWVDMYEVDDIQGLINQGYVFHVIYTWVCPGEKLGKYTEQSVSCGYWQMNVEEATQYHATYELPELDLSRVKKTGVLYESNWARNGEFASDPDDSMTEEELNEYTFVRVAYDQYTVGFGEEIVLLNGDVQEFTLAEAVEIGGFDAEIPRWN